jgi:hypothetical protein
VRGRSGGLYDSVIKITGLGSVIEACSAFLQRTSTLVLPNWPVPGSSQCKEYTGLSIVKPLASPRNVHSDLTSMRRVRPSMELLPVPSSPTQERACETTAIARESLRSANGSMDQQIACYKRLPLPNGPLALSDPYKLVDRSSNYPGLHKNLYDLSSTREPFMIPAGHSVQFLFLRLGRPDSVENY